MATNAFPPAGHTSQSIPALLIGRLVASVKSAGPYELLLTFPTQQAAVGWSSQPDIFTAARAAGFNTALVGWYHPYCRVIGDRLTSCLWEPANERRRLSIAGRLLRQEADPPAAAHRKMRGSIYSERPRIRNAAPGRLPDPAAMKASTNPTFGLTFIHLLVHPPYIMTGGWEWG
jgi:hypothetical protein